MKAKADTILVVEDDENDRIFIETGFRQAGVNCPIHFVGDGAEAISYMCGEGKYADREKFAYPSLLMTDLKMPQTDGFGVLEFLKKNPTWKIVPTVVLSASNDLDDIKKSYMLGASSYHVKPQGFDQLHKLLRILYDYWRTCEVPQVDATGKHLQTESHGKFGERFPQESTPNTEPQR